VQSRIRSRKAPPSVRVHPPRPHPTPPGRVAEPLSGAAAWRADAGAGLVVFLVALPLCLGISLASGAPLLSGIITGVVGGLLVSRLSGSQLMVSGPAAGLTAIVLAAIAELGSFPAFLVAVVLAGLLQIGLGMARAGVIGAFFPSSVIRGMLAGIGLILVIKQLPYALGLPGGKWTPEPGMGGAGGPLAEIAGSLGTIAPAAAAITLASLALLFAWDRWVPARARRAVPGPLAVVLLGAAGAWLAGAFAPALALPRDALVALPVPRSLAEVGAFLTFPDWSALANPAVYRVAATVALVASLESLLSLEATDRMDPLRRTSSPHRELLAQGAGNVVAGLAGGLPMTGVIVRSAANVDAGAHSWRSAWIHGVFLTIAVLAAPALLNTIPLAALAAVLIHTGVKLAHPRLFAYAWKRGARYAVPFAATVVTILATDLLVGIGVGLALGVFFILLDSARNAFSFERHESADHRSVRLALAEEVTFLNKARIAAALEGLAEGTTVTIDAARCRHLDDDVVEMLHDFRETGPTRGVAVRLVGVPAGSASPAH